MGWLFNTTNFSVQLLVNRFKISNCPMAEERPVSGKAAAISIRRCGLRSPPLVVKTRWCINFDRRAYDLLDIFCVM